jgi:D-alanine transaminase
VITAKRLSLAKIMQSVEKGISVITLPDQRWARRDIKSVSLLANILAKQAAREAGAYEAWLVDDKGFITEGSSTNAWIVDAEGRVITRALSSDILPGVTRRVLLEAAAREGIEIIERPFTVEEARTAREAFISASTAIITPVVKVDDHVIGNGAPGSLTLRLRNAYDAAAQISSL